MRRELAALQGISLAEMEPLSELASRLLKLDSRGGCFKQADVEAAVDALVADVAACRSDRIVRSLSGRGRGGPGID